MDPLQAATFITSARRLAAIINTSRAIAQDHDSRETVVVMVCLLAALIVTDFLISILKFIRIILYLCLFEGGRRIVLSWRQRQRRLMMARQHASDGGLNILRLADEQETKHLHFGREYGKGQEPVQELNKDG